MFGLPDQKGSLRSLPPSNFRDLARNAIYQQLPLHLSSSTASSVRSAPSQLKHAHPSRSSHRSLALSVFSWGKRSVRSAPSIYSSSTATIPEDSEQTTTTVEQLINDIALHEKYAKESYLQQRRLASPGYMESDDDGEHYKISLASELHYQNVPESLIDWNLNVTRCKLMLIQMPMVSLSPGLVYSEHSLPQLVGDLAQICHIVLLQPFISDKELIYTLYNSDIYTEHKLDPSFKKSVAEISVKESRLLQINLPRNLLPSPPITNSDLTLSLRFKEIAIRNYLVNLAAAATTAYEYKARRDAVKKDLKSGLGEKKKLTKEAKKDLWDEVRLDVFRRAGLEE